MSDVEKLIREKTRRLTSIPDELLSKIEKVQKQMLPKVIELISLLDRSAEGTILLNSSNIELASRIQLMLRDALLTSDYVEAVKQFAKEFDVQKAITDGYLTRVFADFLPGGAASDLVLLSKQRAAQTLIESIGDDLFAKAISNQVELAIANNASWGETVKAIQDLVIGDDQVDGKLLQYSKQIAHDQFAVSDRSYTSAVAEELDIEWFFYSGSEIATTRPFCSARHNKYFYYKEIEGWASLDWDGKILGTNEATIYSNAGGYNCRHSIIPASIISVPRPVIERNMSNGNFTPSDFERRELGL